MQKESRGSGRVGDCVGRYEPRIDVIVKMQKKKNVLGVRGFGLPYSQSPTDVYSGQFRSGDVLENGVDMTPEDIVYSVALHLPR